MSSIEILRFCKDAYSDFKVDWIVFTASLVGLAIVILASLHADNGASVANMSDLLVPQINDT